MVLANVCYRMLPFCYPSNLWWHSCSSNKR